MILNPGWWLLKGLPYLYDSLTSKQHKYNAGDILILTSRDQFGYGIRPVAVVTGYEINSEVVEGYKFGTGSYKITLIQDLLDTPEMLIANGSHYGIDTCMNFRRWQEKNEVPKGIERIVDLTSYAKSCLEIDWKKLNVKTVDDALKEYQTKEV